MGLTQTTNIGLSKPDEAELARDFITLQAANNTLIISETSKPLTSYTPVLTAQTTPPNVGAGFKRGEYQDYVGFVMGSFVIEFQSPGITAGSGEYGISLPFPVDSGYHFVGSALNSTPGTFSVVGEGYMRDSSLIANSGSAALDVVTVSGVSYVRLLTQVHTGKTSRIFRDAMPFTVADGDRLSGSFFYKRS